MKKSSINFIALLLAFVAVGCSNEESLIQPEAAVVKTGLHKVSIPESSSPNARVSNYNHVMLSFDTWQEFESTAVTLENQVDVYEDNFLVGTENMTEDDLNAYEERVGFNPQQPLVDFENGLAFTNSLRVQYNNEEAVFLADDVLLDSKDPDLKTLFSDEELSLLNNRQEVMVAGEIYRFDTEGYSIYNTSFVETFNSRGTAGSGCTSWKESHSYLNYNSNSRRVKRIDVIRSVSFYCKTKARVVNYKKKNSGWKRHRTNLGVAVQAYLYTPRTCARRELTAFSGYKRKKRRALTKVMTNWAHYSALNGTSVIGYFEYSGNSSTYALQW